MSRFVLLIKAVGDFKHSGKYYLLNGRWHKLHAEKSAPKGAPIAAHPTAGGIHIPAKHLTDAEWDHLKLPSENVNAGTFNKQLEQIKQHAESGNVTAILGSQFGTNTYGKKLSMIANHVLGLYGSEHTVAPGQKAGDHVAVATPKDADHHEQVNQVAQQASDQAVVADAAPPVPVADEAAVTGLALPAFTEGKTTTGVVEYYAKVANQVLDLAAAGDATGLQALKDAGSKPNAKGKISNTWAGKTSNSKLLLALHAEAMGVAGGKIDAVMDANPPAPVVAAPEPEPIAEPVAVAQSPGEMSSGGAQGNLSHIPWESQKLPASNSNAKSHNGKVDQIKAMADAGDVAGLEAFKAGKNTYGVKQMKLAALAVAALKEGGSTPAPEPVAAAPVEPEPITPVKKLNNAMSWASGPSQASDEAFAYLKQQGPTPETVGHVIDALKAHGYDSLADGFQGAKDKAAKISAAKVAPAPDTGPKEGDTKPGADGMLVLKDGHWIKVDDDETVDPLEEHHAADDLDMPNLEGLKNPKKAMEGLYLLKDMVKLQGASALKGVTKKMSASGKLITKLPMASGGFYKIVGYEGTSGSHEAIYHYAESLKEAAGKPKKAPKVKAAPSHPFGVEPMDSWKQVGPQGGSNPGGKFVDDQGVEWYCKFPGNDDVAKSEVLAAKLYAAAGIAGQDAKLISKDGQLGIASKWQTVSKLSPAALAKADGVAGGFAVDAWLGNWDVIGLEYDNLQVGPDGKAMRVDAGGSLEYRAQGGKKAFGNHVVEIDSLRDAKINPQAAAVFGKMSQADITASVSKVLGVSDSKIHALVHAFGPGDAAAKQKMIDTLITRKADLAEKFPKAKKEKKVKPFKPEKISAPPSFMNWGGSGKSGPSSKEFLNAANETAVQSIFTTAQTGSLDAVQGLSAAIYNKESGEVTGSAPVLEHPSQHVKGYAQQAINEINYQLNPPKRFRFEGGHPLHSLNSAYPSHKGPLHTVVSKVGKFILLGEPGTISLETLALPKHTFQSGAITTATFSPAARKAIAAMPETQKQAIKSYTGSGYHQINSSLWAGNPSGAAKSAGEALHALGHDITPGTVLSRKISVHGSDLDQILKSSGKILQEPAIMSTSIRPSSWSGNVQLKMHVGPGVKGLWVGKGSVGGNGALSNHSGEDELILPPNTRLLILSVKHTSGQDADGFGHGVGHVIEAVILPTQASA